MPIDHKLLDEDLKIIRKRRGPDAIHRGSEQAPVDRIKLDSPALMRITGGGIPLGRITRVWGMRSSAKSHIGWMVIKAAMEAQKYAAYWNVEKQFDEVHCRERLGVNTKDLFIGQTTVIEEIATEMELLLRSIDVHVVDSTSFAVSVDELAGEVGDWPRALDARVWKKSIKRINARMDKDENAVILINHAGRDMKTQTEYPKDGEALDFASSMNLHCRRGAWMFYHPEDGFLERDDKIKGETGISYSGLKEPDGIEISVRCEKSRVCRPFRVAKMRLDLNTFHFDRTFELLDAGMFFDAEGIPAHRSGNDPIVKQTGEKSSWYQIGPEDKVQGSRGIRKRLNEDSELAEKICTAMLSGH